MMLVDQTRTVLEEIDFIRSQPATALDAAGKPKRKNGRPEIMLVQRPVIDLLRRICPGSIVAATNTEQRGAGLTKIQRARFGAALKKSGNVPGFFDVVQLLPEARTLLWECKVPKGLVTADQQDVHDAARKLGHMVAICDGQESARWALAQYGIQTIEAPGQPMRPPKVYYERRAAP